jgi:phosphopantetheinyl transferase (holo-ACP synthase)
VSKIEQAAQRVASSTMLMAFARLMMAIGVPIAIMIGSWVVRDFVAIERRVTVIEESKPDLERRLLSMERHNQRDLEEAARMANRFAQIEAGIAMLGAQQAATLRSVERVERVLDQVRASESRRP